MKTRTVTTVASNDEYVRLRIYDGEVKPDQYHEEMLRLERAQHEATRRRLEEALKRLNSVRVSSS